MSICKHIFALAVCIAVCLHVASASGMVSASLPEPNVEMGSSAYFYCKGPGTNLGWFRQRDGNDFRLVDDGDRYILMIEVDSSAGLSYANLTINNLEKNDSGVYVCKNDEQNAFEVELSVYEERDVVISPAEPEFEEGSDLLLNCTVDGTTDQTVTWSVNKVGGTEEPLTGGDDTSHIQVFNNGSLIIRQLVPDDAGVYTCTHAFDDVSKSDMVNVGGEITLKAEKSVKYTEGDRALIECEATVITAALLPSITWLIDDVPLEEACPKRCTVKNTTTTFTVTSKLEITSITMDDRQNYTCIATNSAHPDGVTAVILLRVRDRLAALWPFLGIVTEVVILIIIIFIHEKCSQGEDYGEDDEEEEDPKKEKKPVNDGESDMRMRGSKE